MKSGDANRRAAASWALGAWVGLVVASSLWVAPTSHAASRVRSMDGGAVKAPIVTGLPGFADLVEAVSPAVVSIEVTKAAGSALPPGLPDGPGQPQAPNSSGSGFVISAEGLIVTNHHVIENAEALVVTLNGRTHAAVIRGMDPATDLALLEIDAGQPLSFLKLSDSDDLRVGDWVMVIGSPLQLQNSVSVGVVSAKGRRINLSPDASLENFIQTDAAINFGNSGGPLINLQGEVVGIATGVNFGSQNIGFAIPTNTLTRVLPQLVERGSVERGYLGVSVVDVGAEEAEAFGLDSGHGALVNHVLEDSPANAAGLRYGDIIVEADGQPIAGDRALTEAISARPPGYNVAIRFFRNGEYKTATMVLGERPGRSAPPEGELSENQRLGILYQELTDPADRSENGPGVINGVQIAQVAPFSPLLGKGVVAGDIVVDVNGAQISSGAAFETAVDAVSSGEFLRIYLARVDPQTGATEYFFAILRAP